MELPEKARHIARLTADQTKVRVGKHTFLVRSPTRFQRTLAEEVYHETLESAYEAFSEDELLRLLEEKKVWCEADDVLLKRIQQDTENLKVNLFEDRLRPSSVSRIRISIEKCEAESTRLLLLRHSHDYLLRLNIAQGAKDRYLLGCSLFYLDGTPYWAEDEGWDTPDAFLSHILFELNKHSINIKDIREIARSEPWFGLWEMQKHCGEQIFKASPIDLTDDQRTLIIWSSIYSSIREHPDNLQDNVVSDDDMIDGWMILKRREREKNHVKEQTLTKNQKILNSTEQFYMRPPGSADPTARFESVEQIKEFYATTNTEEGLAVIRQRSNAIRESGELKEAALPDVRMKNRMEQTKLLAEKTRSINKT